VHIAIEHMPFAQPAVAFASEHGEHIVPHELGDVSSAHAFPHG
jgi:hypothetical protein